MRLNLEMKPRSCIFIDSVSVCVCSRYPNIVYLIKLFSFTSLNASVFRLTGAFTTKKVVCSRAVLQNPMLKYYFILQPQQEKHQRFKSFPHFGCSTPSPSLPRCLILHIFHLLFWSFMHGPLPPPCPSLCEFRYTYL